MQWYNRLDIQQTENILKRSGKLSKLNIAVYQTLFSNQINIVLITSLFYKPHG